MLTIYFFTLAVSFIAALLCIFVVRKFVVRRTIWMSQGIPLIGGMGIALSFITASLLGFFLWGRMPSQIAGVIVSSSLMLVFGLLDDWKELSIRIKFIIQIIATSALILFGIKTQIVYIGSIPNIIITFLFIIGITNAFNHLDVMDALAGGVAVIIACAFFIISFINADISSGIVSLALVGAIAGFLAYNLPPARVYMGNAGSHFLGFVLAALAINISYAPLEREVALLSPLLILGFAIFDTVFLILVRMAKKKSPFKKSNDHLVLRFLKSGHSKQRALCSMFALALFFSLCGILVSKASNLFGLLIIAVVIAVISVITYKMGGVRIDE